MGFRLFPLVEGFFLISDLIFLLLYMRGVMHIFNYTIYLLLHRFRVFSCFGDATSCRELGVFKLVLDCKPKTLDYFRV